MNTSQIMAELDKRIDGTSAEEPEELAGIVVQLAARMAILGAKLSVVTMTPSDGPNLSAVEAAKRLGVSKHYLYKHAEEYGAIRIGKRVVFPPKFAQRA